MWDPACRSPVCAVGTHPRPRFFSVLVASTFSDYYSYGLAGWQDGDRLEQVAYRPVPSVAFDLSCFSVIGGTLIAAPDGAGLVWRAEGATPAAESQSRLAVRAAVRADGADPLRHQVPERQLRADQRGIPPVRDADLVGPVRARRGLDVAAAAARAGAVAALVALLLVVVSIADCRWPRFGPGAGRAAPFLAQGPRSR